MFGNKTTVEFDIIVQAQQAINELNKIGSSGEDFVRVIKKISAESGQSFKEVGKLLQQLNKAEIKARDLKRIRSEGNLRTKGQGAFDFDLDAYKAQSLKEEQQFATAVNISTDALKKKAESVKEAERKQKLYNDSLKQLNANLTKSTQVFNKTKQTIASYAASTGASFKQSGQHLKDLYSKFLKAEVAAGRMSKEVEKTRFKNFSADVGRATRELNWAAEGTKKLTRGLNVARLALGALVAAGLFRLITALEATIRKTVESIQQLEMAILKMASAERVLSASGIEVSMKDFRDIVEEVTELFPFISDIDAQKMVSQIALLTKELGIGKDELKDLMMAIPVLAMNAGVDIESATQQMINGLTSSGKGWRDLGILVDAAIIKQKIFRKLK